LQVFTVHLHSLLCRALVLL